VNVIPRLQRRANVGHDQRAPIVDDAAVELTRWSLLGLPPRTTFIHVVPVPPRFDGIGHRQRAEGAVMPSPAETKLAPVLDVIGRSDHTMPLAFRSVICATEPSVHIGQLQGRLSFGRHGHHRRLGTLTVTNTINLAAPARRG